MCCVLKYLPIVLLLTLTSGYSQSSIKSFLSTHSLPVQMKSVDIDHDGDWDLILISDSTSDNELVIHLNNGDGTFGAGSTFASGGGAVSEVEVVDVNRDGNLDLAYAGKDRLGIMFGRGDGTFGAPHLYAGVIASTEDRLNSLGSCDLNRDGNTDFVVSTESKLEIFFGNSDGSVKPVQPIPVPSRAQNAETGDLDGDGNCDVAFVILHPLESGAESYLYAEIQAWYGDGEGGFSEKRTVDQGLPFFEGFKIEDINRDGRRDIAGIVRFCGGEGCNTTMPLLYLSAAGRTFRRTQHSLQGNEESPTIHSYNGPAIGDFNNDGTLDLAGSGYEDVEFEMANFYPLAADGTFGMSSYMILWPRTGPPYYGTGDVAAADFDSDGRTDLAVTITEQNGIAILLNKGPRIGACAKGPLFSEHVCSPNYALMNSPVRVQATANSDQAISSSVIYVNGVRQYTVRGGKLDTNLNLADGDYRLTLKAWDVTGRVFSSRTNIAVRKCALGPPQSVNICSIAEGRVYSSPVAVIASANTTRRITGWRVYVDGIGVATSGAGPVLLSYVAMSKGTHRVTARAWDGSGASVSQTLYVTVQ